MDIKQFTKTAMNTISKHSPEILIGIGITGFISTTIMAVKATPKALDILEDIKEKHEELGTEDKKEIAKDIITHVGPVYLPSVITGVTSIACVVGASSVNTKRNAALATAYTISEAALKDYKAQVIETIGEKKEKVIEEAVVKKKIERKPVTNSEVFITEKGNTLCFDCISGRYFTSDIDKIKKLENEMNRKLMIENYISLNEWYYELGLRPIGVGNELGWNSTDGLIEVHYSSHLADDGRPCLAIDYYIGPRYGFKDLM